MSLSNEKDEGHPDKSVIPRKIQDELIHVIQISLNNIVTQVNNLSKYAKGIFGEISKEIDRISFRLKVLQEHVIELTNVITYKDQNGGLSLQIRKTRTFPSTTVQIQQVYTSKQLPAQTFETHDVCIQTLPLKRSSPSCQHDTEGLKFSPDALYCFELDQEKIVPESEEKKQDKLKQNKHKDHPSKPKSMPQSQLMEEDVSEYHVPAAYGVGSCSNGDEMSSLSNFKLCDINKLVAGAVGKVLSSSLHLPMHGAGEVKNSLTFVNYGTGMGKILQPQTRNRFKTKVFVSPTAPHSPPPLPTNWLTLSRASRTGTSSPVTHLPTQLPSPVLRTPTVTPPTSCLPTIPEAAVLIIPPKVDFSTPAPEPFPYCDPTTDDLLSQGEGQGMPSHLSSSPVTSPSILRRAVVADLVDSVPTVQSTAPSVVPCAGPSSVQSPTPSVAISSIASSPSSPRSSLSSPQTYCIPPPRYPVIRLPRSSTPQTSVSLSPISSCAQTSRSFIPSPRNLFSQSTRNSVNILSRCLDEQSLSPSVAQSRTSSGAPSTRHAVPPQPRSLMSPRPLTPQSLCSLVQAPSCVSSPTTRSVSPTSPAPVNATLKQSPPALPIITKAKNALMEAIRKGVLLHKTKDRCVPRSQN